MNGEVLSWVSYLLHPRYLTHLQIARAHAYRKVESLAAYLCVTKEPVPYADRLRLKYRKLLPGSRWGTLFDCGWIHITGKLRQPIPQEERESYVGWFDLGGEGCVWDDDGVVQGLTNVLGNADMMQTVSGKHLVPMRKLNIDDAGNVDIWVEVGNNGFMHNNRGGVRYSGAWIARENRACVEYYYDFLALAQYADITENPETHKSVHRSLAKAMQLVRGWTDASIAAARAELATQFSDEVKQFTVYAVGHAHLDLAWLWPIRETKRKSERTFSNALYNIERYPDYIFGASQPQQFEWIKRNRPSLFERIRQAAADGRIELQGGMWVEPDTNLPCGESLIRQCYYGKTFFEQEFGQSPDMLWVPDVFGYTGALPQILRGCGMDRFMTIKLSWNSVNKFPHHSFVWKGIDGSDVLVHMPPEGNYISFANPIALRDSYRNYAEKDKTDCALMAFGIGDGGAGPGEYHVQMARRSGRLPELPALKMSKAKDFFDHLMQFKDKLPVYQGELYLEKHRGTYTTQGKIKKFNRTAERMLHDAEWLCTLAARRGMEYPHAQLDEIWKEVLLYQFHDILPGSSIERVYKECYERYPVLLEEIRALQERALGYLRTQSDEICIVNSAPFAREGYCKYKDQWYRYSVPAYASAALQAVDQSECIHGMGYDKYTIYNNRLQVRFNARGEIVALTDKMHDKHNCVAKTFNTLRIYTDKRMIPFNAWDIDPHYMSKYSRRMRLVKSKTYIDGAQVVRENVYRYHKSTLIQKVILQRDADYVVFDTKVSWHEKHKMLRADFYPSSFADTVRCDISFGYIDRSTRSETSQEKAQFEICAHKWVDVYDGKYGVALINDCKYGHRVKNGKISLNLLRAPVYPDKTADRGDHTFRYAIYPHAESTVDSRLRAVGYELNRPMQIVPSVQMDRIQVISDSVLLESVFVNADGDTVLRLYESKGNSAVADVVADGYDTCTLTDMLCRGGEKSELQGIAFRPFEVKTLVLSAAQDNAAPSES